MVVLIVGKRYGVSGEDDVSITHREFREARKEQIPTITFVEPQVLSYKEVFDADPKASIWDSFAPMDKPRQTFTLLDEIKASETFNAIIPFSSVDDAKQKLKLQFANFFGQRLTDTFQPMSQQLRDVLAEIKTIRNQLTQSSDVLQSKEKNARRFLAVTRFLLNDNAADYRKFLARLFGDLDAAIGIIADCADFNEVLEKASYRHEVVRDDAIRQHFEPPSIAGRPAPFGPPEQYVVSGMFSGRGGYVEYADKFVRISQSFFTLFDGLQKSLTAKAKAI